MRKADYDVPVDALSARMLGASEGLRRQLRIRNILLIIVGIEATVFIALRTWDAF